MSNKLRSALITLLVVIAMLFTSIYAFAETTSSLKITKQPVSVTVSSGTTAKIDVDATGEGLTYKWYYKNKGDKKFSRTTAFKSDSYSVKMSKSRAGRQVYCVIKDKTGDSVKTKTVTLSMGTTLKVSKQPKSVTVKNGKTAKVSFSAKGNGLKYKWYYKNAGDQKYSRTKSFTGTSYSVKMNADRNGRKVYCVITDKYGSSIKTKTVTLSRKATIKITKQPKSVTVKNGANAKVTLTATGKGLKYAWYYKDAGSSKYKKTDSFKGNSYKVEMTEKRYGRKIYCKITDKYGYVVKSDTVTLNMKGALPTGKPANSDCADCKGNTSPAEFDINATYTQSKELKKHPLTFEAVFQINKKDINASEMEFLDSKKKYKETVLFGNDDTNNAGFEFSITSDGHPKLGVRHDDWYRRCHNFLFDDVNVFSDKAVHLAITFDAKADKVKCYVNGKLKQTITNIPKDAKSAFTTPIHYAVGGDNYCSNPNYFRGKLYSLSVWSDVRSASEVMSDFANGLKLSDKAMLATYNLTGCDKCMLKDYSSNGNKLIYEKLWLTEDEIGPVGDYDYAFAVVGDTQTLIEKTPEHMATLYDWIVANKASKKIEYVLGLGDITETSYEPEWTIAKKEIYKMNDVVPYLLARGNHDIDRKKNGEVISGFNVALDDGIYNHQLTGTMEADDLSNAYRTINIGGIDYLFLALDFGPNADMLAWADSVVEAHPDHRVVVITHAYMYRDGTTLDGDDVYPASNYPLHNRIEQHKTNPSLDGDDIWERFASKHSNVQLILSGHDPYHNIVYRQDKGVNDNTVTQMLIDPQRMDLFHGPTGMVAMFYFSDNGNKLTVRYYSTVKDMYGPESSHFTIDLS